MSHYISEAKRLIVKQRAKGCCEYCLTHQDDYFFPFEIDHIISLRHDGKITLSNLALSCSGCNRMKAADIGTYLDDKMQFVRLFHPRLDKWDEHFEQHLGQIIPITDIGRATVKPLDLNHPDRLILRQLLAQANLYPRI